MDLADQSFNEIIFNWADIKEFPFPENEFRKWILFIIENEKNECGSVNFIFCSDTYLLKLNKEYLNHNTLTDIITFDYSQEFNNVSGDIYISIDRIRENANQYHVDFFIELSRILAHGILHIIGYDDKLHSPKN